MLTEFWGKWYRYVNTPAVSWPSDNKVVFLDRREIPWSLKKCEISNIQQLSDFVRERAVDGWPAFMAVVQLKIVSSVGEMMRIERSGMFVEQALKIVEGQGQEDCQKTLEQIMTWRVACSSLAAERCVGRVLLLDDLFGDLPLIAEKISMGSHNCSFIVSEKRPFLHGSRIASWILQSSGLDTTVISDNAIGYIAWKKMVETVLLEAVITEDGDFLTTSGGYQTAVVCSENKVEVLVIAYPFIVKNVSETTTDPKDILQYRGKYITSPDLNVHYSDYDLVDRSYISKVITPFGVYTSVKEAVERLVKAKIAND